MLDWTRKALRESHKDEKRHHDEAVARLQSEYTRLKDRIDAMYVDKLDGRINAAFFDQKSAEWRGEQDRVMASIRTHQAASRNYLDEGVRLLELASRARELFEAQQPREKRRLLNFVVSNCSWKDGELSATLRQPFDLLAVTASAPEGVGASEGGSDARFEKWLPEADSIANLLYFAEPSGVGPVPTVRQVADPPEWRSGELGSHDRRESPCRKA